MRRALGLLLLFAIAAAYMRLGLFVPISWTDEGVIVYPVWRVAEGELPYRDFQQIYGPSVFFLNALLFRLFEPDLAPLRYFLLAVKAFTSVLVYVAARRFAARPFALVAFAVSVVTAGLVWPVSTIPYASFYGTALCLAGVVLAAAPQRLSARSLAAAGLCLGLAATFKQTTAAFAGLAVALALLLEGRGSPGPAPGPAVRGLARAARLAVPVTALGVALAYLDPSRSLPNFALLVSPVLLLLAHVGWCELRRGPDPARLRASLRNLVALSLGFSVPLAAYAVFFVSRGLGDDLVFNMFTGLPRVIDWFTPFPRPTRTFLLWQLAVPGAFASLALWRGRAADELGPRRLAGAAGLGAAAVLALGALLFQAWPARSDVWWFFGSADLLRSLPFLVVGLSLASLIGEASRPAASLPPGRARALRFFTCYATISLLGLHPAADVWHVLPLMPVCLPLLAHFLERLWQSAAPDARARGPWRATAAACVGVLGIAICLPAVHDVVTELRSEHAFPESLPRASGVTGGTGIETRHAGEMVRFLDREREGRPILVLSGQPLFYFLLGRPSPAQDFEYLFYLLGFDQIRGEVARELADEAALVDRLRKLEPLIIDDRYSEASTHVRRAFPKLAAFVRNHYENDAEFGGYRVLRPTGERSRP